MQFKHEILDPVTHKVSVRVMPDEIKAAQNSVSGNQTLTQHLVQTYFTKILNQKKLYPVAPVQFQVGPFKDGQMFTFSGKFETRPQIKSLKLDQVSFQPQFKKLSEKAVAFEIQNLLLTLGKVSPMTEARPIQAKEIATVNFDYYLNGSKVPGIGRKNQNILLGFNRFFLPIEGGIVGMSKGQTRDFPLDIPKTFNQPAIAGKKVIVRVTLTNIQKIQLPQLTDQVVAKLFAGKFQNITTVAQLQEAIRKQMQAKLNHQIFAQTKSHFLNGLATQNPFPLPPAMVQSQKAAMHKGKPPAPGSAQDQQLTKWAEQIVRASLIVEHLALYKKLQVTQAEVDQHMAELALSYGMDLETLKKRFAHPMQMAHLKYAVLENKVVRLFLPTPKQKAG